MLYLKTHSTQFCAYSQSKRKRKREGGREIEGEREGGRERA